MKQIYTRTRPFYCRFVTLIFLQFMFNQAQAQSELKAADEQYELFNYKKAVELYEKSYQQKPTLRATERIASGYQLMRNYKEAESWYRLLTIMPGSSPHSIWSYARALQQNNKYMEARIQYQKYAELNSQVSSDQRNKWFADCDSAQRWMLMPANVRVYNEQALSSPKSDWGAVPYDGGLVFSSDRTGNAYLGLYELKKGSTEVSRFVLSTGIGYHLASPSFSSDGNELYFTLTKIPIKPAYKKEHPTINIEIYSSRKDEQGNWSAPLSFKYNKADQYSVGDPALSKDGNVLYFVSNMLGGKGGTDIYYCKKGGDGTWGKPVNASSLNTIGNERTPFSDDLGNFYFSSDGLVGMGGLDIFSAKIDGDGFSHPKNMGYPLNSPQDDFSFCPVENGKGYFSSNRTEGTGNDEIFSYEWNKPVKTSLEGQVYKKGTTETLKDVVITLLNRNGETLKVQTGVEGRFRFDLETDTQYGLRGDKTGFCSDSLDFNTLNLRLSEPVKKKLYLDTIILEKAVRLKNIYYDFNDPNVKLHASLVLDELVKMMKDNPTIWLELGSHTDSRGGNLYNMTLSQQRANIVVQYMVHHGISKNRIVAKGYGKTQLLKVCDRGTKCSEMDHQLNRRTEFKILKY